MLWLDFFRGCAALIVVAYHFSIPLGLVKPQFGYLAVDLFFVLSGLVLTPTYVRKIDAGMSLGTFMWHRYRRLWPMALLTAALVVVMNFAGMPEGHYMMSSRHGVTAMIIPWPYPARFGLMDAFPTDGPMWSLWAELASNVVWFLALRAGRRVTGMLFGASAVAFLAIAVHHGNMDVGSLAGVRDYGAGLLRALAWFGVGYGIAQVNPRAMLPASAWAVLLIGACALFQAHWVPDVASGILLVLVGSGLLNALRSVQAPKGALISVCTYLGALSYPLYLIHAPSHRIAMWATERGMNEAAAFVLVLTIAGVGATAFNTWIVNRLPKDPPRLRRAAKQERTA